MPIKRNQLTISRWIIIAVASAQLLGCAEVNTFIYGKSNAESSIAAAQSNINGASEMGAEKYAYDELNQARGYLSYARQLLEDGKYDEAQEQAAKASSSANKAGTIASDKRERERSKRYK